MLKNSLRSAFFLNRNFISVEAFGLTGFFCLN
jgi:hypothetical protein